MADKLSVSDIVTKVYEAARNGSSDLTDLLKRLKTEQRKTALKKKTKDGSHFVTPLIITAHNGHLNSVKILLHYGADIDARGTLKIGDVVVEGCTPLWAAAATGHLDVVRLLIERNADVDGRTSKDSTPLRAASHEGHLDIVRCLVERGAHVNAQNIGGDTPLMTACYCGHLSVVTYLSNEGAFLDQQCKGGGTALHDAAHRGHLEIVSQLLALGALQLPNNRGLTPLLYACEKGSIEIVEYLIKRPECTKEQRIDALELLGATIANGKSRDIEKAFSYMKRGMEMRYEDLAHPLLKKKMEPVEAYQNRKESQTLEELALLEGDDHAIGMEGLIIRERILGSDNPAILYEIRYRGTVLSDCEEYELCFGLWKRAMEKATNNDVSIIKDLELYTYVFAEMVQKRKLLRPNFIEEVFEILVAASEKRTEKLQEGYESEEQEKTLYYALYLLMIYTKVKVQNANMTDFLQRFLRLNPCCSDGNTLLHLAAWHETPIKEGKVRGVCKLPCVETMKFILHAGGDVNAVNTEGNTPLHLAVKFKPAEPEEVEILREMLLLLVDIGADPKLANKNGQTPLNSCETDEARRILSKKGRLSAMNVDVGKVRKF
ncbi:unnamed protein product [Porites evermanni]|uniref:Uncharacterized protein n=1 Tax=Porites evermanni TaxID=104178 RepID=A0ABN8RLJ5_9CNID|nr:unnamed protein product [Porites evermanni]